MHSLGLGIGAESAESDDVLEIKSQPGLINANYFDSFFGDIYNIYDGYFIPSFSKNSATIGVSWQLAYFFLGKPSRISHASPTVTGKMYDKFQAWLGMGLFFKFLDFELVSDLTQAGGIKAELGVIYNLDSKYFIYTKTHALRSQQKLGDYESTEFFLGTGVYTP